MCKIYRHESHEHITPYRRHTVGRRLERYFLERNGEEVQQEGP